MSRLTPANPEAYLSIAVAQLDSGAFDQASVPLLQVLLLDNTRSDASGLLVDVYRRTDAGGCALHETATEVQLDPSCPTVRSDTCQALEGLSEAFAAAKQWDAAQQLADTAVSQSDCPREPFARYLSGSKPSGGLAP
jgi:hypothetical protein